MAEGSLLIVAPNWLGDAVMALPAIADLRRGLPHARITVAARPSIAPLFSMVDDVDAYVAVRGSGGRSMAGFETALLLPNSFRSALAVWRAGVPERWGYRADWRQRLLTRSVKRPTPGIHQVDYYQHLVGALGFATTTAEPRLTVTDAIRLEGRATLESRGWDGAAPLVALAPGAAYGGAKRWPPESFAELSRGFAQDRVTTVLVGSAADAGVGREIEALARRDSRSINLIGATDLPMLAGVFAHCRALVTNDSGAMHVGAAAGVRVTAVFGPTDEQVTGPRLARRQSTTPAGRIDHAVLAADVACRPCMLRECPLDHRCMRGVTADAVLEEARRTL